MTLGSLLTFNLSAYNWFPPVRQLMTHRLEVSVTSNPFVYLFSKRVWKAGTGGNLTQAFAFSGAAVDVNDKALEGMEFRGCGRKGGDLLPSGKMFPLLPGLLLRLNFPLRMSM